MGRVLIVPYGIEMNEKAGWISADFVLIVPYGIEMEMAEGLALKGRQPNIQNAPQILPPVNDLSGM